MAPVVAEQAEPGVDLKDMEAVVRHAAGQDAFDQMRELVPGAGPEAVLHGVADVGDAHGVQQGVAHPVGLHHPGIERIGDACGPCNELQVGPGAGEALGQFTEPRVRTPDWP